MLRGGLSVFGLFFLTDFREKFEPRAPRWELFLLLVVPSLLRGLTRHVPLGFVLLPLPMLWGIWQVCELPYLSFHWILPFLANCLGLWWSCRLSSQTLESLIVLWVPQPCHSPSGSLRRSFFCASFETPTSSCFFCWRLASLSNSVTWSLFLRLPTVFFVRLLFLPLSF